MSAASNQFGMLDVRRVAIGMTVDAVARRAGVSASTVERVLSGRYRAASFETVQKIAAAVGAMLRIEGTTDVGRMRREQADRKAREMVLASTPAGGGQAENVATAITPLGEESERRALQEAHVEQIVLKLLTGSNRKLWAD